MCGQTEIPKTSCMELNSTTQPQASFLPKGRAGWCPLGSPFQSHHRLSYSFPPKKRLSQGLAGGQTVDLSLVNLAEGRAESLPSTAT